MSNTDGWKQESHGLKFALKTERKVLWDPVKSTLKVPMDWPGGCDSCMVQREMSHAGLSDDSR